VIAVVAITYAEEDERHERDEVFPQLFRWRRVPVTP
jgi:hypothetical protein